VADRLPTSDTVAAETAAQHQAVYYASGRVACSCSTAYYNATTVQLHLVEMGVEAGIAAMAQLRDAQAAEHTAGVHIEGDCDCHPTPPQPTGSLRTGGSGYSAGHAPDGLRPPPASVTRPWDTPLPGEPGWPTYRDGSTVEADRWAWPFYVDTMGHPILPNEVAALLCHPEAAAALRTLLGVAPRG
jgi:hypothetical protein